MNLITLFVIDLFRFSISWGSFNNLYLSRNLTISSKLFDIHEFIFFSNPYNYFIIFYGVLVFFPPDVCNLKLLGFLLVYLFFLIFVDLFKDGFKKPSFIYIDFLYCFVILNVINFCSILYFLLFASFIFVVYILLSYSLHLFL